MECMTNSMFYDMLLLAMFIAVVMFNHTRCRLILEHYIPAKPAGVVAAARRRALTVC